MSKIKNIAPFPWFPLNTATCVFRSRGESSVEVRWGLEGAEHGRDCGLHIGNSSSLKVPRAHLHRERSSLGWLAAPVLWSFSSLHAVLLGLLPNPGIPAHHLLDPVSFLLISPLSIPSVYRRPWFHNEEFSPWEKLFRQWRDYFFPPIFMYSLHELEGKTRNF